MSLILRGASASTVEQSKEFLKIRIPLLDNLVGALASFSKRWLVPSVLARLGHLTELMYDLVINRKLPLKEAFNFGIETNHNPIRENWKTSGNGTLSSEMDRETVQAQTLANTLVRNLVHKLVDKNETDFER